MARSRALPLRTELVRTVSDSVATVVFASKFLSKMFRKDEPIRTRRTHSLTKRMQINLEAVPGL